MLIFCENAEVYRLENWCCLLFWGIVFCLKFKVGKLDEAGASVIYAHYHSKGPQGGKNTQDRSSGSGAFARDSDAIVDLIEVEIPDEQKAELVDDQTDTA